MEEKLEKILLDLNIGYITVKVAKRKILRLFAVVGQSEQLPTDIDVGKMVSDLADISDNEMER